MPRFSYVSRDSSGQRVTAVAEAQTRQNLLSQLREKGLTVVDLQEMKEAVQAAAAGRPSLGAIFGPGRVSAGEMAVFWRQFSTMVSAGLPVVAGLESIAQELESPDLQQILNKIIANMWEGMSLSQSIARHPKVFSPMVVGLITAAEESGSLPEVAAQLALFLENRDRLLRKVQAALTYPIFLAGFFGVVMAVATFWIIPKFQDIYSGFNAKLPWLTETVFAVNTFILAYFLWLAAAGTAAVLALVLWARRPTGRAVIDRVSLTLPLFGKLLQRAAVSRFCRSLAVLLKGGIPINRALELAQETSGNTVVTQAIRESRDEIMKGAKIAKSFKGRSIFPPMVIRMVSAGEETGNLSELLERVADFYEARVDSTLATINTLLEPIMIIVIGGFVLIFVLALYMPIFRLAMTVRG